MLQTCVYEHLTKLKVMYENPKTLSVAKRGTGGGQMLEKKFIQVSVYTIANKQLRKANVHYSYS